MKKGNKATLQEQIDLLKIQIKELKKNSFTLEELKEYIDIIITQDDYEISAEPVLNKEEFIKYCNKRLKDIDEYNGGCGY